MATAVSQPNCRVVYVGSSRNLKFKFTFLTSYYFDELSLRQELATEMKKVRQDMQNKGLQFTHVVPVKSSPDFARGWTEGAWLYFGTS